MRTLKKTEEEEEEEKEEGEGGNGGLACGCADVAGRGCGPLSLVVLRSLCLCR